MYCRGGEQQRHAPYMHSVLYVRVEIGTSKLPCLPLFAACVGLIACFAVLCVRFRSRTLPAVPIAMRCSRELCFALAGLWAARGYDGASKLEGWLASHRRTSVQFARGRACVQGVGGA